MQSLHLFVSWIISVILGSIICATASEIDTLVIFWILSLICSAPYFLLMLLFNKLFDKFWQLQLGHVILALLTGLVMMADNGLDFKVSVMLLVYFMIDFICQCLFYYLNKNKSDKHSAEIQEIS